MIRRLHHRGPDGLGFWQEDGVALGHNRLAIVGLGPSGDQPMVSPDGRWVLLFNGEIYNHRELRRELAADGWPFRGDGDTEVLLAAWATWGRACLGRLRGMFACAVHDRRLRRLTLVRDRLGIKPLYWWRAPDGTFAFASELKALVDLLPPEGRRPHRRLAREYLAWNLLDHEPEETFLDGVRRLAPGGWLTWNAADGVATGRWWRPPDEVRPGPAPPATEPARRRELAGELRERLAETVRLHLRSDVPVGTALSGGLDSSAIVALVAEGLDGLHGSPGLPPEPRQHTFTACFDEPRLDERPYVDAVVERLGVPNHRIAPTGERLAAELERWLWAQDEPVGGTGAFAHWCVAGLAREHGVKVLLDGQGADEQLAGYRKFLPVHLRQLATTGRWPAALAEAVAFFASPSLLRTIRWSEGRRYLLRSPGELGELFPRELPERPAGLALGSNLGARLGADLTRFSLPVLLRYEDRNTMAHGVEARVPFVDHELVEWLAALPPDVLLHRGWTKWLLREAMADRLPPKVVRRKSKLGFSTPESRWLAGPLLPWLRDRLARPRHLGEVIADPAAPGRLLARFEAGEGSRPVENLLFRCAVYESWGRLFLETPPEPPPLEPAEERR